MKQATACKADAATRTRLDRMPYAGRFAAACAARHHAPRSSGGSDVAINPMPIAISTPNASRRSATPTLVHGDTHPGNLYIEPHGRAGFLDAQMRRAPWVQDVAGTTAVGQPWRLFDGLRMRRP